MYFNMSQWYLKSFMVIMFDRDIADEARRAGQFHDELLAKLVEAGYSPVRLGIQSMAAVAPDQQSYVDLLAEIEAAARPQ